MDPLTHLVSGGLVSRIAKPKNDSSLLLWLCVASSIASDVDFLVAIFGPEANLAYHRGITHSVIGGLFIALLLTLIFWIRRRSFRFLVGFSFSCFLVFLHIFLDFVTSYGTQILAPFSRHRFALDSVFIIDPILVLSALTLFFLSILMKNHAKRLAITGVVVLIVYPLFNMIVNQSLSFRLEDELKRRGVPFQRINLLPEPLTPFFWKVIITNSSTYEVGHLSIFRPWNTLKFTPYPRAITSLVRFASQQSSMFRTYMWFAAYPVVRTETPSNETAITLTDLRFRSHLFANNRLPFQLTGYFNSQQRLIRWEYQQPFGERFIQILE